MALLAVKLEDEKVSDFERLTKLAFENITKDFEIIDKNSVIEVKEVKKRGTKKSREIINFQHKCCYFIFPQISKWSYLNEQRYRGACGNFNKSWSYKN